MKTNNFELTVEQVAHTIAVWDVMFPEKNRAEKQLTLLAATYHSRLVANGVTPMQFKYLAGKVTDNCSFFPKVKDILEAIILYGQEQPVATNRLQIAESSSEHDQTPEEKEFVKNMGELAAKVINKEMSAEEAASKMESLIQEKKKFSGRMKA